MKPLLVIETETISLTLSQVRDVSYPSVSSETSYPGRLVVTPLHQGVNITRLWWAREYFPGLVESDDIPPRAEPGIGPRLFEQTDYCIYITSKHHQQVALTHQDPILLGDTSSPHQGEDCYSVFNFGSQVGLSQFEVVVDGVPEIRFEVEVFPSKMDYLNDYYAMLAEVQDVLSGLAIEYLRSTYRHGAATHLPNQTTQLEWFVLLRHIVEDLERALQYIGSHPSWGIRREEIDRRADKVRHIDDRLRSQIRKRQGKGGLIDLRRSISVRERLVETTARPTLDTPEHRWLAMQLRAIAQRLAVVDSQETAMPMSQRRQQNLEEIRIMRLRLERMKNLGLFRNVVDPPPLGFASLQMMGAPGYREAYRCCLLLSLGLRIEGGPLQLSVKDLSLLYEYWTYLALLRIIAEETGEQLDPKQILAIKQNGLRVMLHHGKESTYTFSSHPNRTISVVYNPTFRGQGMLVAQKPDIVIRLQDDAWPQVTLIVDAKYRIDTSRQYEEIYGVPGPPEDAINVLHRYRDAILCIDSCYNRDTLKKNVIQAVAAYPFRDRTCGEFKKGRLWEAVREIGVGAVPLLPGNIGYLQQWVRDNLSRGGFSRAEQVVPHSALEAANRWKQWASENVLVGVLRGDNPEQHLNWIENNRIYYMPLLKRQRRQYAVKYVGVYLPASISDPPGVYYYYPVEEIDVAPRYEIRTPWKARKGADGDVIVYRLTDKVWCAHPVINRNRKDRGLPVREHRWTSMLALQRASTMDELLIESVPEWALYEELQARRLDFAVRAIAPRSIDPDTPHGRCWFVLQSIGQIKFVPPVGYVVQSSSGSCNSFPTLKGLLSWMDHAELAEPSATP